MAKEKWSPELKKEWEEVCAKLRKNSCKSRLAEYAKTKLTPEEIYDLLEENMRLANQIRHVEVEGELTKSQYRRLREQGVVED